MLTELDLNLLLALHALLTERHVTRAGARVGLSQPAMSAALARLRRFFDDELLVRTGNRYVLTPLAEQLVPPLDQMMDLVGETLALRSGFDPATSHREFGIQLSDYALFVLVRPLLEVAEAEAPGVRLRFEGVETGPPEAGQGVDLLIAPPLFAEQEATLLWSDPWVVAVADDHPDVGETMTREQLSLLPYVQFRAGNDITNPADLGLEALGIDRQIGAIVGNFTAALFMLRGTRLFTLTPTRLAASLAGVAGIRLVGCPVELTPLEEHMSWRPANHADPGHRWLRETIVKVAANL